MLEETLKNEMEHYQGCILEFLSTLIMDMFGCVHLHFYNRLLYCKTVYAHNYEGIEGQSCTTFKSAKCSKMQSFLIFFISVVKTMKNNF